MDDTATVVILREQIEREPSSKMTGRHDEDGDVRMQESTSCNDQLLITKFFVPASPHTLISRPRLIALLDEGLQRKLTLLSAPAGSGKTTLLSTWIQSRPEGDLPVAWVSLDEGDNDPVRFWSYVITALDRSYPGIGQEALADLYARTPSIEYILTTLINNMATGTGPYLLILDDYHMITEQEIHDAFRFLLEHQPGYLHVFLMTRVDPPLPLCRLRGLGQMLELRNNQLRFTSQEAATFLTQAMGLSLGAEMVQAVETRTEGWIASLQLAALSLQKQTDPTDLLARLSGDNRYILDYLTDEVLGHQRTALQTFLHRTSILERLSAPLCDALMQQSGSQEMLEELERANLFVISLDSQRRWYRYHALFAEALRFRLQQSGGVDISLLHLRASRWYAEQGYVNEAIQHALLAQSWQWAADLIEARAGPGKSLFSRRESWMIRRWLQQLPEEIIRTRPRLCLAYARSLRLASQPRAAEAWLQAAEAALLASHSPPSYFSVHLTQVPEKTENDSTFSPKEHERDRLLGEILALRARVAGDHGDSRAALDLCQRAETHLSKHDHYEHALVAYARALAFFANGQAKATTQSALESSASYQAAGMLASAISYMGTATFPLHMQGQLHAVWRTCQRAIHLGTEAGRAANDAIGLIYAHQADILREWNQLDEALDLALQGLQLGRQPGYEVYLPAIYIVLVRIHLSRGDSEAAKEALQQVAQAPLTVDNPYYRAHTISVEQARLWLAVGDLERAVHWTQELEHGERQISSYAREREDVARARILLAQGEATAALNVLAPLLINAQTAERWDHVIEMFLLQALAYQLCRQMPEALAALAQAVSLAEPEGYMRRFLDEGPLMHSLLSTLRGQERKQGPTPYLDRLVEAFLPGRQARLSTKTGEDGSRHPLSDPLSERELEVLRLLAQGSSNQDIAEELVVALSTVKHHVSTILSKLGASNRTQAVAQARSLGLAS